MTALVTGGAGFIGSNLVEELVRGGEDVIVLDNLQTGSLRNLEGLDVEIVTMSCNDIPRLDVNADMIFHLGIPSSSPMYKENPLLVGEAVNGFIAVMELARRCGARVVYASTSSLYNGLEPPHREDMVIRVTDYYTEARFAMERIAELYRRLYGVSSMGMRFFSVYGPKEESKGRYANMVTQFLWGMMRNEAPVIYGDGSQTRDFIYVKDVVRALMLAMDSDYNGVLNVGTGRAHSFNDVIRILGSKLGVEMRPKYIENPIKNYVQHTLADTGKAERCLGFRAAYSLEEGISEIIGYYRQ
ncbi:MAG TPA: NAD-dependent epimerase/dehydratase family protein [Methanothrix sp.]|nr:NAD-dependent epimerase/dehydratase family protein [Methanothrix sp.]HOK58265.1 NAD-dependent epimerase/dehydratase family protein [Methanothrix sp.]HOL43589.1 NAD-dependent epimerase/dehydratase family protein [Methanothrix sp.]HPO89388.1 NAD-dependent epimerase/dehydratase family protein [Methanothrix sp.]